MFRIIRQAEFDRRGTDGEGREHADTVYRIIPKDFIYKGDIMTIKECNKLVTAAERARKYREQEWYGVRAMLGYTWAMLFVLLGAREAGKSYSVTEYFVRTWKKKGIPFYWLRLNEASMKKLLANNAEKLVDADIYRKYKLNLKVKGNSVYDGNKKMATVLALSTFANDKGVGYFDKDFLNDPNMEYHICLDEFQLEKTQRSQGDICYQFIQQIENLIRSTKERVKIFLIGNTLEEASDILTMLNFIPESFGRYKLKSKRAVIDYMPPSEKYKKRREGTLQDLLAGNESNFTNEIKFDRTLVVKKRLVHPTSIIVFDKNTKFTVWDGNIIATYNRENCNTQIAMRPYIDLVFNQKVRDQIIAAFDARGFLYHNLISFKKFQKEISLIKPRKQ